MKMAVSIVFALACWASPGAALDFSDLPVKEITVFKDGHAFVLHEGTLPLGASREVFLDYLPRPVIGTFWPYAADPEVELTGVKAGRRRVTVDRTALNLREILESNTGAEVMIEEKQGQRYAATLAGIPSRSPEELEATNPPHGEERLTSKGDVILLETVEGIKVVRVDQISKVTFKEAPRDQVEIEEFRNVLELSFETKDESCAAVEGGMVYLQRGIRWIPHYRITLDGQGSAAIELRATLINEMIDLEDVTAHLVIGVPSFAFKDTVDPISLQQTAAQLSQYFREYDQTAYAFSNAIMTQAPRMSEYRGHGYGTPADSERGLGPDVAEQGKEEDLFIFSLDHLHLKKGERMVVPVARFALEYKDIYTLDLPIVPPPEVRRSFSTQRQQELARLLHRPKVMHKVRMTNDSAYPLTTAPALLLKTGRLLGQGMMTYTAVGGGTDVEITTAIDIKVKTSSREIQRTDAALAWNGGKYPCIDMQGTITLTNFHSKPVEIEVRRTIAGELKSASDDGVIVQNDFYDHTEGWPSREFPEWWWWHSWPSWWYRLNGPGYAEWRVNLKAGEEIALEYEWHYFWN